MTIPVTCPSCLTRFSVSDKFAGKSGPCPKCKATIKIPELSEQVVIHAPVDSAPKDSKGRSILKPLRREDVKLSLPVVLATVIGSLAVFSIAVGLRLSGIHPPAVLLGLSAPLLAFPLVLGGYWFLRDDELQGYSGRELLIRCLICSAVFAIGWGIYSQVPSYVSGHSTVAETTAMEMVLIFATMIGIGTAASVLTLELEIAQGLLLFMLYFIITFALAWISGAPLSEAMPGLPTSTQTPAASPTPSGVDATTQETTNQQPGAASTPESTETAPPKDIPKLLQ